MIGGLRVRLVAARNEGHPHATGGVAPEWRLRPDDALRDEASYSLSI